MPLERFVITGQPGVLRPLLELLEHDPETAVHRVARNNQTDPELLVVSIDSARAAAMGAALGSMALIEADEPLADPTQPPHNPMQPPPGPLPPPVPPASPDPDRPPPATPPAPEDAQP